MNDPMLWPEWSAAFSLKLHEKFFASDAGREARAWYLEQFEKFQIDLGTEKEMSEKLRNMMREPPRRLPRRVPDRRPGTIYAFPPRQGRAYKASQCPRMMQRPSADMKRFCARVWVHCEEDGVVDEEETFEGDWLAAWGNPEIAEALSRMKQSEDAEKVQQVLNVKIAKTAQAMMLSERVPMTFEVSPYVIMFGIDNTSLSDVEVNWALSRIGAAAERVDSKVWPRAPMNGVGVCYIDTNWSDPELAARLGVRL